LPFQGTSLEQKQLYWVTNSLFQRLQHQSIPIPHIKKPKKYVDILEDDSLGDMVLAAMKFKWGQGIFYKKFGHWLLFDNLKNCLNLCILVEEDDIYYPARLTWIGIIELILILIPMQLSCCFF